MNIKESGYKNGVINNARSELTSINTEGISFGQVNLVCRIMKRSYNNEPPKPKYEVMWDPDLVFHYINCLGKNGNLNLKDLTLKTVRDHLFITFVKCSEKLTIQTP